MTELTPQERLQPALLDRLTDEDPAVARESRERRVMSKNRLKQAVLRDLTWLFNATRLETSSQLSGAAHARRSVVNFGLPALSGRALSSLDLPALERTIRQTIEDFEPRVLADTLQVRALVERGDLDRHNVIGVEIRAQLWAQPVPLELLLRTDIDIETGQVELSDLTSGRAI
jgi:type VI secretion system protein ImpF